VGQLQGLEADAFCDLGNCLSETAGQFSSGAEGGFVTTDFGVRYISDATALSDGGNGTATQYGFNIQEDWSNSLPVGAGFPFYYAGLFTVDIFGSIVTNGSVTTAGGVTWPDATVQTTAPEMTWPLYFGTVAGTNGQFLGSHTPINLVTTVSFQFTVKTGGTGSGTYDIVATDISGDTCSTEPIPCTESPGNKVFNAVGGAGTGCQVGQEEIDYTIDTASTCITYPVFFPTGQTVDQLN
jgi:hypothetical protein